MLLLTADDFTFNALQELQNDSLFLPPALDLTQSMQVYWNDAERLCLALLTYTYYGGAHGNYSTEFINLDLEKGELIQLSSILANGYDSKLVPILNQKARAAYQLPKNSSLNEFFFEENIHPTDNFALTDKGILFVYPPYELAAYAMGEIALFVSFEEIKDLMK